MVRPALRREPFFIAAVATLLLLPLYWYGKWNDLLLARVAAGAVRAELALRRGGGAGRGGRSCAGAGSAAGPPFAGLVLVLGLGAPDPAAHLVQSFQDYGPFRYEHAEGIHHPGVTCPPSGSARTARATRRTCSGGCCASPRPFPERRIPDEPVIQSGFDVYLDHGTLIYVKDRCTPEDAEGFIFVKVVPVSPGGNLPADRRRQGLRYDQLYRAGLERFGRSVAWPAGRFPRIRWTASSPGS